MTAAEELNLLLRAKNGGHEIVAAVGVIAEPVFTFDDGEITFSWLGRCIADFPDPHDVIPTINMLVGEWGLERTVNQLTHPPANVAGWLSLRHIHPSYPPAMFLHPGDYAKMSFNRGTIPLTYYYNENTLTPVHPDTSIIGEDEGAQLALWTYVLSDWGTLVFFRNSAYVGRVPYDNDWTVIGDRVHLMLSKGYVSQKLKKANEWKHELYLLFL